MVFLFLGWPETKIGRNKIDIAMDRTIGFVKCTSTDGTRASIANARTGSPSS